MSESVLTLLPRPIRSLFEKKSARRERPRNELICVDSFAPISRSSLESRSSRELHQSFRFGPLSGFLTRAVCEPTRVQGEMGDDRPVSYREEILGRRDPVPANPRDRRIHELSEPLNVVHRRLWRLGAAENTRPCGRTGTDDTEDR